MSILTFSQAYASIYSSYKINTTKVLGKQKMIEQEPSPQDETEQDQQFQITEDSQGVLRESNGQELSDPYGFLADPEVRESLHNDDRGRLTDRDDTKYHIGKDGQVWKILSPDEQFSAIPETEKMTAAAARSRIDRDDTGYVGTGLVDLGGGGRGKRNFGHPSIMDSPFMATLSEYNGRLGGGTPQNPIRIDADAKRITKIPAKSDH